MKNLILVSFFVVAGSLFARPNITSYLYELNGDTLKQIKYSERPLTRLGIAQGVVNMSRGETPNQEQLNELKVNIKARQAVQAEKSSMLSNPRAYIEKVTNEKTEAETIQVIK